MTLDSEAHILGTSKTTCFYILYNAASEIMNHLKLSCEVEMDTQYKSINPMGTCPQNMLRYSKKEVNRLHIDKYHITWLPLSVLHMKNDHMMMQVSDLESESFDKYKANKENFEEVE